MYHVSLPFLFWFFLFECRIVVPPSPLDSNIPRSYFGYIITSKMIRSNSEYHKDDTGIWAALPLRLEVRFPMKNTFDEER